MAVNWKRRRPGRLDRLAAAIEAIGQRDRQQADENDRIDHLRASGALALHEMCRYFVDEVNVRLSEPALILTPGEFARAGFRDPGPNLFQINLRGRLLVVEFEAIGEPMSTDDFRRPYVLHGSVRSLNQDLLDRHLVAEKSIFYCPQGEAGEWHYVDHRTYRSGRVTADLLASELERLV